MFIVSFIFVLLTIIPSNDKDIWNLPEFESEQGEYTEDWIELSRLYNVPQWWRDAKFGAWSHWDPQSAAEYGDWYSRGMYMQGHPQYEYHLQHYGHPSEYGYKDLSGDNPGLRLEISSFLNPGTGNRNKKDCFGAKTVANWKYDNDFRIDQVIFEPIEAPEDTPDVPTDEPVGE